jgi:hypothetical protein
MRLLALAIFVTVATGCGMASSVHYDRAKVMECLRQTNSMAPVADPDRILLLFAASTIPDAAAEGVVVGFGTGQKEARARAESLTLTPMGKFFGIARHRAWEVKLGDAYAAGTGAFEPAAAKREGISGADAGKAINELDASVQPSVEKCLKESER